MATSLIPSFLTEAQNNRFLKANIPDLKAFHGQFEVRLILPLLPSIRFFNHAKDIPVSSIDGGGKNVFIGGIEIGDFRTEVSASDFDGQEVLKIIYDLPDNLALLKGLVDEVRDEGNGQFFCRGLYTFAGIVSPVMYFTMTRVTR